MLSPLQGRRLQWDTGGCPPLSHITSLSLSFPALLPALGCHKVLRSKDHVDSKGPPLGRGYCYPFPQTVKEARPHLKVGAVTK